MIIIEAIKWFLLVQFAAGLGLQMADYKSEVQAAEWSRFYERFGVVGILLIMLFTSVFYGWQIVLWSIVFDSSQADFKAFLLRIEIKNNVTIFERKLRAFALKTRRKIRIM